jgi:hypothetical protein
MIGFIEHIFTITINYSAIANYPLHKSLGQASFSSLYSHLLSSLLVLSTTQIKLTQVHS